MKDLINMLSEKLPKSDMSDAEQQAKMEVLKDLFEMAMEMSGKNVGDHFKDMQEVTIAAPDKESLLEGMESAEDLIEDPEMAMPEMMEDDEDEEEDEDK